MAFDISDFYAHDCYKNVLGNNTDYIIPLYHGSPNKVCIPKYGFGNDKHDYGKGFYTTLDYNLACEWAVCAGTERNGYIHKYELNTNGLTMLNLNEACSVLTWLAVLAKHRSPANSKRDKMIEQKLIDKYYIQDIEDYDIIIGYRADDSFFSFARQAIQGGVDICLLDTIMKQGKLGYQIFLQSEKAFNNIKESSEGYYKEVEYTKYNSLYTKRDFEARQYVAELIDSDLNTLTDTIEKYLD